MNTHEETLEIARSLIHKCPSLKDWVVSKFPELKESEDEQSKKWILEYLYDGLRKSDVQFKDHFKAAIAWLEKQGEQKIIEWSEEDEEMYNQICNDIDYLSRFTDRCDTNLFNQKIDWLKSLKQRMKGE